MAGWPVLKVLFERKRTLYLIISFTLTPWIDFRIGVVWWNLRWEVRYRTIITEILAYYVNINCKNSRGPILSHAVAKKSDRNNFSDVRIASVLNRPPLDSVNFSYKFSNSHSRTHTSTSFYHPFVKWILSNYNVCFFVVQLSICLR